MKTALAISHVAFEDLGTLEGALLEAGYAIERCEAATASLDALRARDFDLVVVLGGPISVYEQATYPFLIAEIELLRVRLTARRPTLGICLGAQLMAAALGARVFPGSNGRELGWIPLQAGEQAAGLPAMAHLLSPGLTVLHWHGDTFDLPSGASHLASSTAYPNQAFALGRYALGLQFHPEVTAQGLERWYVGHACELTHAGINVSKLRQDGLAFAPALEQQARQFWHEWLGGI